MSPAANRVASAVEKLKEAVLADPALRQIAKAAKTPDELDQLWTSPEFREIHSRILAGISEADVKAYADELNEDQLDAVTGGAAVDYFDPALNLTPRQAYTAVFFGALQGPAPHL